MRISLQIRDCQFKSESQQVPAEVFISKAPNPEYSAGAVLLVQLKWYKSEKYFTKYYDYVEK